MSASVEGVSTLHTRSSVPGTGSVGERETPGAVGGVFRMVTLAVSAAPMAVGSPVSKGVAEKVMLSPFSKALAPLRVLPVSVVRSVPASLVQV